MNTIYRFCPDCGQFHTHEIRLLADGEMPYKQENSVEPQYQYAIVVFACFHCNIPWMPVREDYQHINHDQAHVMDSLIANRRDELARQWYALYG